MKNKANINEDKIYLYIIYLEQHKKNSSSNTNTILLPIYLPILTFIEKNNSLINLNKLKM